MFRQEQRLAEEGRALGSLRKVQFVASVFCARARDAHGCDPACGSAVAPTPPPSPRGSRRATQALKHGLPEMRSSKQRSAVKRNQWRLRWQQRRSCTTKLVGVSIRCHVRLCTLTCDREAVRGEAAPAQPDECLVDFERKPLLLADAQRQAAVRAGDCPSPMFTLCSRPTERADRVDVRGTKRKSGKG